MIYLGCIVIGIVIGLIVAAVIYSAIFGVADEIDKRE